LGKKESYRIAHLKAMAREEKKFNKKFGTKDVRYQNLLKRSTKKKRRNDTVGGLFY